jgi:hypothetical protein
MRQRAFAVRAITAALGVGAALSFGLTGCSADDDDAERADDDGPTTTARAADPADTADTGGPADPADVTGGSEAGPVGTSDAASGATPESLASVPETGVPGLDSDDVVCRAWSRFGGSFQVVAVAASFGSGDPDAVAALEVMAAPTVTSAYADLVANWPAELADEAEPVADDFLGPFARRADQALAALEAAGADTTTKDAIVAAWEAALAGRDPSEPEIVVELPTDVQALVDEAAVDLAAQVVPLPSDPSLVTDVEVPLTEQYLVDNCPDRGTLGGVDG